MKTKDRDIDFGDLDEMVSRSKKDKIKYKIEDMMEDLGDLLDTLVEKIEKIIFG